MITPLHTSLTLMLHLVLLTGGAIRHSVEVGEEKRCMSCTVPHCTTCNCLGFCRRCDSSFHLFFGKCWNPDCAECHTRFCKECGCDGKCRVCKWGPVLTVRIKLIKHLFEYGLKQTHLLVESNWACFLLSY